MSVEAMWSVVFIANNQNLGGGVVVFETDRVFGGDSSFLYHGKYECTDGTLKVTVRVRRHLNALENVFGVDDFTLNLEGELGDKRFILTGSMEQDPSQSIAVKFHREEELP